MTQMDNGCTLMCCDHNFIKQKLIKTVELG